MCILHLPFLLSKGQSSPSSNDVVNYLEREAAEGSEAIEWTRPTSTSPPMAKTNLSKQASSSMTLPESEVLKLTSSPMPLDQLLDMREFSLSPGGGAAGGNGKLFLLSSVISVAIIA